MEKKIPMRTCIACRNSFPKRELNRVVKSGEEIKLDLTGKLNGRGAYVCKDAECLVKARKAKRLERSFSCAIPDGVYERMEEELKNDR